MRTQTYTQNMGLSSCVKNRSKQHEIARSTKNRVLFDTAAPMCVQFSFSIKSVFNTIYTSQVPTYTLPVTWCTWIFSFMPYSCTY